MISYVPGTLLGAGDPKANTMNTILALRNLWPRVKVDFVMKREVQVTL